MVPIGMAPVSHNMMPLHHVKIIHIYIQYLIIHRFHSFRLLLLLLVVQPGMVPPGMTPVSSSDTQYQSWELLFCTIH